MLTVLKSTPSRGQPAVCPFQSSQDAVTSEAPPVHQKALALSHFFQGTMFTIPGEPLPTDHKVDTWGELRASCVYHPDRSVSVFYWKGYVHACPQSISLVALPCWTPCLYDPLIPHLSNLPTGKLHTPKIDMTTAQDHGREHSHPWAAQCTGSHPTAPLGHGDNTAEN